MKGVGNEYPGFAGSRVHDGLGLRDVLKGISRFGFECDASGVDAHPLWCTPRWRGRIQDGIQWRRLSASKYELCHRIEPGQVRERDVFIAAKHDDAVNMRRHVSQGREPVFQWRDEPTPHR